MAVAVVRAFMVLAGVSAISALLLTMTLSSARLLIYTPTEVCVSPGKPRQRSDGSAVAEPHDAMRSMEDIMILFAVIVCGVHFGVNIVTNLLLFGDLYILIMLKNAFCCYV